MIIDHRKWDFGTQKHFIFFYIFHSIFLVMFLFIFHDDINQDDNNLGRSNRKLQATVRLSLRPCSWCRLVLIFLSYFFHISFTFLFIFFSYFFHIFFIFLNWICFSLGPCSWCRLVFSFLSISYFFHISFIFLSYFFISSSYFLFLVISQLVSISISIGNSLPFTPFTLLLMSTGIWLSFSYFFQIFLNFCLIFFSYLFHISYLFLYRSQSQTAKVCLSLRPCSWCWLVFGFLPHFICLFIFLITFLISCYISIGLNLNLNWQKFAFHSALILMSNSIWLSFIVHISFIILSYFSHISLHIFHIFLISLLRKSEESFASCSTDKQIHVCQLNHERPVKSFQVSEIALFLN